MSKIIPINDYAWSVNSDGSLTITDYIGNGGDVVIPSEIDGKSVTSIGDWAFYGCTKLTNVIIPDSLTIDYHIFYGCYAITDFVDKLIK